MKMKPSKHICLVEVIPTDAQIANLYEQLKTRLHNISHETLPSYEKHKDFVANHPYRKWYILEDDGLVIGNLYVQNDNSVGINFTNATGSDQLHKILTSLRMTIEPLPPIPSVRYKDFFVNVPVTNKVFQQQLDDLGYRPSQISYVLSNQNNEI